MKLNPKNTLISTLAIVGGLPQPADARPAARNHSAGTIKSRSKTPEKIACGVMGGLAGGLLGVGVGMALGALDKRPKTGMVLGAAVGIGGAEAACFIPGKGAPGSLDSADDTTDDTADVPMMVGPSPALPSSSTPATAPHPSAVAAEAAAPTPVGDIRNAQ